MAKVSVARIRLNLAASGHHSEMYADLPFLTCSARARFFSMAFGSVSFECSVETRNSNKRMLVSYDFQRHELGNTDSRMLLEDVCKTILVQG